MTKRTALDWFFRQIISKPSWQKCSYVWPLGGDTPSLFNKVWYLNLLSLHRQLYKGRLNIPIKAMLGYQSHDDTSSKSGSTTKNMYSIWTPSLPTRCRFKQLPNCISTGTWLSTTVVSFPFIKRFVHVYRRAPPNWSTQGGDWKIWLKMMFMSKRT